MRLRIIVARGVFALASLSVSVLNPQAWADTFTVSIQQTGSDVVASGSGALSVSGVTVGRSSYVGVRPDPAFLTVGSGQVSVFSGVSGPSGFGVGGPIEPVLSTMGGRFGIDLLQDEFVVPFGYIAGTDLTSSDLWSDATLHDLGLMTGSYSYALASGDTFVVDIGSPTSISPEPSTFVFLGTGLLGLAGVVRKRIA